MKLIALRCPNCTEPLAVENDDVVVACNNCQMMVAISQNGAVKMAVSFVVAHSQHLSAKEWVPVWVFNGRVIIKQRQVQGGRSGEKDSERLWGVPRSLYVPAWELSLEIAQNVGSQLIQNQPELQRIERPEGAQFVSAVVTPDDGRKLLEFIILAIEARRKDMLKRLEFDLEVGEPQMMAFPKAMFL
jgi:hypothetical protein